MMNTVHQQYDIHLVLLILLIDTYTYIYCLVHIASKARTKSVFCKKGVRQLVLVCAYA